MNMFQVIGQLSVSFANIESHLTSLTELLITREDPIVGSLIADDFTLERKIQLIQKLVRFRYCHKPAVREEVENVLKHLNTIKKTRNEFIHGMWSHHSSPIQQFRCVTAKWQEKDKSSWSRFHTKVWTFQSLSDLLHELAIMNQDMFRVLQLVERESMVSMKHSKPQTHK